jgi:hypothetical protein
MNIYCEMFLIFVALYYISISYMIVTRSVLEVSKASANPKELKFLKCAIIAFSPIALLVILGSKK